MRNHLPATRSPKAKPAQSQSPIQKKKILKFVNQQITRQDKSMQALPVFNLTNPQSSSPTADFKKQIEERFRTAQINIGYTFPRKLSELSISSDGSNRSLENVREYDLHIQNFRVKQPIKKNIPEPLSERRNIRDNLNTEQPQSSSSRLMTSVNEGFDYKSISGYSKKGRAQTPVQKHSQLIKKTITLSQANNERSFRMSKTPTQNSYKGSLNLQRQSENKSEKSQEPVSKRPKSSTRAQSSSKSSSRGNFKTVNLNLGTPLATLTGSNRESKQLNKNTTIKIHNLLEDENNFALKTMPKIPTTKSCADLKNNSQKLRNFPGEVEKHLNIVSSRADAMKNKIDLRAFDDVKSLTNSGRIDSLNKISQPITQRREKESGKTFRETEEFTSGEVLQTEPSPFIAPIIGTLETAPRKSMGREGGGIKQGIMYNKIQKEQLSKERVIESFRSPSNMTARAITTGPLTTRNMNEQRGGDQKLMVKSVWSPRENSASFITSPKKPERPLRPKEQKEQENSSKLNCLGLGSKKKQLNLEHHIAQLTKNLVGKQVPTITLATTTGVLPTEENERKENKLCIVSKPVKGKNEPRNLSKNKPEKQIMLKRSGELSSRYQLEKSEIKVKSYFK